MPKKPRASNYGELIKTHRQLLNMTQEQLADKLNISFQQIQKYEYNINAPSIEIAKRLCKILKIPTEKIFGEISMVDLIKEAEKDVLKDYEFLKIIKKYPKLKDLLRYYEKNYNSLNHIDLLKLVKSLNLPKREK